MHTAQFSKKMFAGMLTLDLLMKVETCNADARLLTSLLVCILAERKGYMYSCVTV